MRLSKSARDVYMILCCRPAAMKTEIVYHLSSRFLCYTRSGTRWVCILTFIHGSELN